MPSQERLRELFDYRDGQLFRRTSPRNGIYPGPVEPSHSGHGYLRIGIDYGRYPAHRLIWMWHHGSIPAGFVVDHIDHDRTHNRIENLRLVTHTDNMRNVSRYANNRSGFNGVVWNGKAQKWQAQMKRGGRNIYLGVFDTVEEAAAARASANQRFGLHPNHGLGS